jgi:demethylmenaquinone methyltransferase/2-methoxy-6-polyprenyl-1,4-benzoquinol methylase
VSSSSSQAEANPEAQSEAWSRDQLAQNPHERADKPERVRRMFAAIARSYDLNNRLHSFGRDQAWRKAAVKLADVREGEQVLDCACGTGDLTLAFARTGAKRVVGTDFTQEMLDIAGTKLADQSGRVTFQQADAMNLPFDDESFDIVSIAFGIRNVADPARAIAEFYRVLRPGGRVVILEFDEPRNPLIRLGNDLYTKHIMPMTATLIARDRSGAYRYLPKSVETFMKREAMQSALRQAGFGELKARPMTFGVCVCHVGKKEARAR